MLLQNTEFLVTKNPIFVESIALQYFQHFNIYRGGAKSHLSFL